MERRNINIGMKEEYGDKKECLKVAEDILDKGLITGVTSLQMAAEIYSHHYVYILIPKLPKFLQKNRIVKRMYESCENGVDLSDHGDPGWRKIIYHWVYKLL